MHRKSQKTRSASGSVMLEFVIAFPVVLVLILMVIQLAHVWTARLTVHYAAFCAARSALVTVCDTRGRSTDNDGWADPNRLHYRGIEQPWTGGASISAGRRGTPRSEAEWVANKAAAQVCSLITIGGGDAQDRALAWPTSVGPLPASIAAERKTRTTITEANWTVTARVEHDFPLICPIVGPMIAWGMNPWDKERPWAVDKKRDVTGGAHQTLDGWDFPHIRLVDTVILPKPYKTVIASGNWNAGSDPWRNLAGY